MLRQNVVFRGWRARDCKVCNISWKKIYDADGSAGLNVLERECDRSAIWGRVSVSFEGEYGREGSSRN